MNALPCTIVLCLLLATPAAAVVPTNHLLNTSSVPGGFETQSTPVIRSHGSKVVAVWTDVRLGLTTENKFFVAVSNDSGTTFVEHGQPPSFVNAGIPYVWRNSPQVAIDPASGKVFIAGIANSTSGPLTTALAIVSGTFAGNFLNWSTPTFIRFATVDGLGSVSLEVAPAGGSLHLLVADGGSVKYQRSIDGNGAVWSAPVALSAPADNGTIAAPKLVAGVNTDLHAAWSGPFTMNSRPIRHRLSPDLGVTWNAEETPATMRINPVYPAGTALNPQRRFDFSMAVNRVAGSTTIGRIGLVWGETWNFTDEPFPPISESFINPEFEPNGDPGSAIDFAPGDVLIGSGNVNSDDVDFWRVTLAAGEGILIWGDSSSVNPRIFILDTGGSSMLMGGFTNASTTPFVFRAPHAGSYLLQMMFLGNEGNAYRVRTRSSAPNDGEAKDARDITSTFKDPGGAWQTPRHHPGPTGYAEYLPTLAFAADGLDYAHWYDFSHVPGAGNESHLVMKRGLLDQSAEAPVIVSTQPTDWSMIFQFVPPGMGAGNDMWRDPNRLLFAWTDGRQRSPDAYAASFPTSAYVVSCPADTTVPPNGTAYLRVAVHNRNPLFEESVLVQASGGRSWPGGTSYPASLIAEASTGYVIVPVAVPDTAAVGVYPVSVSLTRSGGIPLGTCPATLTISNAVTAVGDPRGARFELRAVTPNPARGDVHVDLTLPTPSRVHVAVYGPQGNRVRMLADSEWAAGPQRVSWDGRDDRGGLVPSGVYFVRVSAPGHSARRPVVILR